MQNRNLRTTLVCCRLPPRCQGTRRGHPVTGSPPSGMKAPTRHRGLSPTRANMSGRPGNRSKRGIVRKTGGRVLPSASPRARRTRASQARPAALPVPRRTLRRWRKSVAGLGKHHFATLHYGQIVCAAPKHPSRHSRHAKDCPKRKPRPTQEPTAKKTHTNQATRRESTSGRA